MASMKGMTLVFLASFLAGCSATSSVPPTESSGESQKGLPPAYQRNKIVDPQLRQVAAQVQEWALGRLAPSRSAIYSRVEVLPPTQTVQPYGVGVYQKELRLPVILTTGPGWAHLDGKGKEAQVAQAFRDISGRLEALPRKPTLRPTLTVQTPQGLELAWINHLDPAGKNLHDE